MIERIIIAREENDAGGLEQTHSPSVKETGNEGGGFCNDDE